MSVVAPVSRAVKVPRSKDAFVVSPSSQVMRASGMGLESAAWATALNSRVARSDSSSASVGGLGVTTSTWGRRCTVRPARRSCPKPFQSHLSREPPWGP